MARTLTSSCPTAGINPAHTAIRIRLSPGATIRLGIVALATGERLLICHADRHGNLILPAAAHAQEPDYIACCYPARVRRRYPHIADKIVGDWDGATRMIAHPGGSWLVLAPESLAGEAEAWARRQWAQQAR